MEETRKTEEIKKTEEMKPYQLWLCSFAGMGNKKLCRMAEQFGGAREVYFASPAQWRQALGEKQALCLQQFTETFKPWEEYEKLREQGIRLVTLSDKDYPRRLKEIPDAPYGLFVKGRLPGNEPAVAVVGARDCSQYGAFVAEKLGEMLGKNGIAVVSGMARGIDGISQTAALKNGGISYGVLGCGVDICYPAQNRTLYDRLVAQGGLISSYPPGTPALARNFPPRNRIVSGLADAVVVVEAREKSGTLITVDMALEQGREVYAVPGRITDRLSDGCNRLLRQGAAPLLSPEELLEALAAMGRLQERPQGAAPSIEEQNTGGASSPEAAAVCKALDLTPQTAEEIRRRLPEEYRHINLNACLIGLCMEELAVQVGPGCFCAVR